MFQLFVLVQTWLVRFAQMYPSLRMNWFGWLWVNNFSAIGCNVLTESVLESTPMWIVSWNFCVIMPDTNHTNGQIFAQPWTQRFRKKHGFCWHTPCHHALNCVKYQDTPNNIMLPVYEKHGNCLRKLPANKLTTLGNQMTQYNNYYT